MRILASSLLLAMIAALLIISSSACSSQNAEKIQVFCSEWHRIAEAADGDCGKLAADLESFFEKQQDNTLYGSTDNEECRKAAEPCRQAVAEIVARCGNDPAVNAALDKLQSR